MNSHPFIAGTSSAPKAGKKFSKHLFHAMRRFSSACKLKRLALGVRGKAPSSRACASTQRLLTTRCAVQVIAGQLTDGEMDGMRAAFRRIDHRNKGVITYEELAQAVRTLVIGEGTLHHFALGSFTLGSKSGADAAPRDDDLDLLLPNTQHRGGGGGGGGGDDGSGAGSGGGGEAASGVVPAAAAASSTRCGSAGSGGGSTGSEDGVGAALRQAVAALAEADAARAAVDDGSSGGGDSDAGGNTRYGGDTADDGNGVDGDAYDDDACTVPGVTAETLREEFGGTQLSYPSDDDGTQRSSGFVFGSTVDTVKSRGATMASGGFSVTNGSLSTHGSTGASDASAGEGEPPQPMRRTTSGHASVGHVFRQMRAGSVAGSTGGSSGAGAGAPARAGVPRLSSNLAHCHTTAGDTGDRTRRSSLSTARRAQAAAQGASVLAGARTQRSGGGGGISGTVVDASTGSSAGGLAGSTITQPWISRGVVAPSPQHIKANTKLRETDALDTVVSGSNVWWWWCV